MNELDGNIHRHMEKLCLETGSKHCGSAELEKAGNYVAEVFAAEGYQVRKEHFPVRGWRFGSFMLRDETLGCDVPASTACYFSNSVDIRDVPLWIDWRQVSHLEDLPVKGRLCFIAAWHDMGNVFGYNAVAEKLDTLGAAATIFLNRIHTQLAPSTKIERSPFLKTLAVAAVAQEGAIFMANHRKDVYHLVVDATCYDTTAFNVIARLGEGKQLGVVGAHYDTAPLIQGAQDNTGGTVILMEMARLLKKEIEQVRDQWTIEFAAFSGEEYIAVDLPMGSGDYVRRHQKETIRWYLNIDDLAPYFAYCRVGITGREKLPDIRYPYEVVTADLSGDDKSFHAIGVPTIWIEADKLYKELHTATDNLDCTDFARMAEGTREYCDIFTQLIHEKSIPAER